MRSIWKIKDMAENNTNPEAGKDVDNSTGMTLVDFCVQLDDCTPTVRFLSTS